MITYFYDIECYTNYFLVILLNANTPQKLIDEYIKADIAGNKQLMKELRIAMNVKVFRINSKTNDIMAIVDMFQAGKMFIGFNNHNYDDVLINYILSTRNTIDVFGMVKNYNKTIVNGKTTYTNEHINTILKGISDDIIVSREFWTHPKQTNSNLKWFRTPYTSLDFFRCIFDSVNRKGLKQALINANWYKIQDLPIKPHELIKEEQYDDMEEYCFNDVLGTRYLFQLEGQEIGLRFSIGAEYGYNFLGSNRANMADRLFINFYSQTSNIPVKELKDLRTYHTSIELKKLISPKVHFDNPLFQELYNKIYNHTYMFQPKEIKEEIYLNGTGYNFMLGGMHTIDRVGYYNTIKNPDMLITDVDGNSFYPTVILNEQVCPKHLNPNYFLPLGRKILNERLEAKTLAKTDSKYKAKAEALKIILNIVLFGKLGANDSFLKDDAAKFKMTINGQFFLLMLVEKLEANNIHVISANTDGIVSYYHKDLQSTYERLCNEWSKELTIGVEFTPYEIYIRRDVNNYVAVKIGFTQALKDGMSKDAAEAKYVKCKGFFSTEIDIKKGYKTQIISKAVKDYYLYGTTIEETVKNCNNIYDFIIAQNVDKHSFKVMQHFVTFDGEAVSEELQSHTRFYISNSGVALTKRSYTTGADTALSSHRYCTVMNNYIKYDNFKDYDVNYNYYIAQAYDVLYILSNQKVKGTKNVNQKYNAEQGMFNF